MPTIIKPKIISNIVQQQIVPNKPKILANEQIYVYVPRASTESPGIASFNDKDFLSFDGHISLSWPMKTQIEEISNPLNEISRVKLLSDEFEQTGNESEITNPLTEIKYISDTAEVKLKRTNRNAFLRPELIMLDNSSDFEKSTTPEGYSKYTLKRNNPLVQPALVKLDNEDFNRKENETIDIRWPYAHNSSGTNRTDGYGLIKINPTSKLFFTGSNLLDVDLSSKLNKDFTTLDEKTTVSLTDIIPIQTDNKTYRTNLAALKEGIVQDLVKLKFEIVDELPNTGETNIIYLLPEYTTKIEVLTYEDLPTIGEEEIRYLVLDTNKYYIWNNKYVEYTNIYKEYIWLDELNKYEQLGTSDIELYANKVAYDKGISNLLALNVQDAIDELADIKVDKVEGSSLISSDELGKLAGIDTGAQVNTIEVIKVDNTSLSINEDKEVNIDLSGKVDKIYSTDYAYTDGLVFTWDTDHYIVGTGSTTVMRNAYPVGTATEIVIPKYYDDGTHGTASVTEIGVYSFRTYTGLVKIIIPDSITRIHSGSFFGCSGLTYIIIPNSVIQIDNEVFVGCTSLKSITIPDYVTQGGSGGFELAHCINLIDVKLPNNDSFYSGRDNMFYGCSNLTTITIPKNVEYMPSMFNGCSNLTKVYIKALTPPFLDSTFTNSGITASTGAIYVPYESLTAYKTATGWSTYANRIYPIPDGKDLTDRLDIKVDKVEGSTLITSDELSKLSGIDTGAQVNTIEVIKVDNTSLTINEDKEVNIDLSGKVDKVEGSTLITNDELSKLAGIDTEAQVNTIEVIKVDNTPLTINEDKEVNIDLSGKVDKTIMGDKRRVYGVDASNNQELIEFDIIPTENSNNLVTSGSIYTGLSTKEPLLAETPEEPEDMFLGLDETGNKIWKKVTSAEISPNGIDYLKDPAKTYVVIKTPADNDTFTLLTGSSGSPNYTIEWGDGSSDNIATTDNPTHEYEKAGMYLITISGSFPNGIAYGQSANVNKNKIIEVYGGRNYTLFIRDSAFYGCTSLTTANFPNATSISGTYNFYNCTNLTTIHLPRVTSIEYSAFYGCTSLTTANFPNATSIGEQVFKDCTNLTTANFPNATDIRNNAFRSCTSLTTANFPNATSIGNYAFYGCTSLKELTIGNVTATNTGTAFENVKLTNLKIAQDVTDTDIDRITTFYADNGGMFIGNETKHGLQVEKTPSADLDVVRKVDLDTHTSNTSNPHTVTKSQVGLSNAEDTADLDKPISTATQTALDLKATKLNIAQDQVPRKIGTGSGEPNAGISYTASATANTLMVRDANGQTRIVAGTENTHVVNKSQLDAVQGAIPANSDFTLTGLGEKSYNNLTDRPTIPTNSSFTLAGLSEKSYNSLTDKPTIPVAPTIVQDTGTSATSIMSQKAVTDKLAIKDDQPYSQHGTAKGNGYRLVAKFDYSAAPTGDNRKVFRFKVKQGHGNGVSYVFWGDYIVGLGTSNQITCSGLLSKSDGTYGKCGYRVDAANHTIYFYIYTGQYSAYYTSDITSLTPGTNGTVTWYTESGVTSDTVTEGINSYYPIESGTLVTDKDLNEKLDKTTSGSKRRVYGVNASNNQEMIEFDTTPTESSTKLITSSGVYTAIQTAIYDSWGGEY